MSPADTPTIRVLVADDQRAVREALATVLEILPAIDVVGLASDGQEAVELSRRLRPDVVLMDLRMPGTDGVAATETIAAELPATRVVVLTTFADDESILRALHAGAIGFLTKDAGREQISLAVQAAAAGQSVLDVSVQSALLRAASPTGAAGPPTAPTATTGASPATRSPSTVPSSRRAPSTLPDDVTPREAEVLRGIAAGWSNARIGEELYIAEVTVKSHINHLFAKIGVRSRADAVRYAYAHGLVDPA